MIDVLDSPAPDKAEELVGPALMCARLGCCEATLRNWTRAGRLPAPVRLGRKVLWSWANVVEHLQVTGG
jgi:predicted DNA-binding transcriptional regulator AlpA